MIVWSQDCKKEFSPEVTFHIIQYVTMWCHEYNSEKSGFIRDRTWPHGDMYFYRSKIFHTWAQGMSEILFFQLLKRNFVSSSSKARFYLLYKHWWNTKPFTFAVKCTIYMYYVTKVMVIFSHYEDDTLFSRVRTSYFRAKAHLLHIFHWCLYKINLSSTCISRQSCFRNNYISLHLDEILVMYIYLIRRCVV